MKTNYCFVEIIYIVCLSYRQEKTEISIQCLFYHMQNMYFEPVIVFTKGNPDNFIGFQKEMGSFRDAFQLVNFYHFPTLKKKKKQKTTLKGVRRQEMYY